MASKPTREAKADDIIPELAAVLAGYGK